MAILTVTLNPALDLETRTPRITPQEKSRCTEPRRDPGGGGLNVARALQQLGGQATALVAAGGPTGAQLGEMLRARGVAVDVLPAPGDLRQNLSVIESETGAQYRFIFPGPTWTPRDADLLRTAIMARVASGDWVVLSGSLPPGFAPDTLVALIGDLAQAGARVVADTSGAALRAIAAAPGTGLHLLRMDGEEAGGLAGRDLAQAVDSADFAAELVARGVARIVICARGKDGSVLVSADGRWAAPAVAVPVVSRTGAGDSFVAGALLALAEGRALPEVLQYGCASASAAVTTPATELCDGATMRSLLPGSAARTI